MPTFKITVAYDGTDYVGWQRQANGVSVQALIEEALREIDGRAVAVAAAGRTDSGVHALGQVAAFTIERALPPDTVVRAVNAYLPDAIRVMSAEEVPPAFHPRFDASSKTYRYRIWNAEVSSPFERRFAWHVTGALDIEAMRAAAQLVEGRHDFAAFQASGSDVVTTVREVHESRLMRIADCGLRIECGLRIADCGLKDPPSGIRNPQSAIDNYSAIRNPQSAILEYQITGTGFLRHMVRTIVGTLVEIGRGRWPIDRMGSALDARDRAAAGPTAPAAGLFLVRVDYAAVADKS
jgi:tRNA pseudouridine38-40 synthase